MTAALLALAAIWVVKRRPGRGRRALARQGGVPLAERARFTHYDADAADEYTEYGAEPYGLGEDAEFVSDTEVDDFSDPETAMETEDEWQWYDPDEWGGYADGGDGEDPGQQTGVPDLSQTTPAFRADAAGEARRYQIGQQIADLSAEADLEYTFTEGDFQARRMPRQIVRQRPGLANMGARMRPGLQRVALETPQGLRLGLGRVGLANRGDIRTANVKQIANANTAAMGAGLGGGAWRP